MDPKGFGKKPGKFGKYFSGSDIPIQMDAAGLGIEGGGQTGLSLPGGGSGLIGGKTGALVALVLALFLSGCVTSKIIQKVDEVVLSRVDKDLEVTVALAEKYGKEELAKCAKYLRGALAGKRELLQEKTGGIISAVLKIKLLREFALEDEDNFKAECGDFAADLMLEIGRTIGDGKAGFQGLR